MATWSCTSRTECNVSRESKVGATVFCRVVCGESSTGAVHTVHMHSRLWFWMISDVRQASLEVCMSMLQGTGTYTLNTGAVEGHKASLWQFFFLFPDGTTEMPNAEHPQHAAFFVLTSSGVRTWLTTVHQQHLGWNVAALQSAGPLAMRQTAWSLHFPVAVAKDVQGLALHSSAV